MTANALPSSYRTSLDQVSYIKLYYCVIPSLYSGEDKSNIWQEISEEKKIQCNVRKPQGCNFLIFKLFMFMQFYSHMQDISVITLDYKCLAICDNLYNHNLFPITYTLSQSTGCLQYFQPTHEFHQTGAQVHGRIISNTANICL